MFFPHLTLGHWGKVMAEYARAASPMSGAAYAALEAETPYQHTLKGLLFPWRSHLVFDVAAGLSLALIGLPLLAAAWTLTSLLADYILQRLYRRWSTKAAGARSELGLLRLGACCGLRSALWMSAPVALAATTGDPAAFAYAALTALSMVALAASAGWASPAVWAGMAAPAALGILALAFPSLRGWTAVGVLMGLGSFACIAVLIALGTRRTLAEWSDSNGRATALMDEMKVALARSEAAERRLGIAAEIADLHVYEVDYVDRSVHNLAGRDVLEAPLTFDEMNRDGFYIVHPDDKARVEAAWAAYEHGDGPYRTQYRLNRRDGQERWVFAAAEMTRDERGRAQALVGALVDITEMKRGQQELLEALRKAESASRAKGDFLATISHEIRTPLNGVLGMAQAMERNRLPAAQRRRLDVIRRSGEVLLDLLNNVLDLSKIEAGKLELENGRVDVQALAQRAVDGFSAPAAQKDVALDLTVAPDAGAIFLGDPARVGQIVLNLVSNAVKFTERGRVDVRLDVTERGLLLEVTDTGIGIDPDQREILFEKFVQADSSTTRRFGGTGLGLAITRELVEAMGGTIEVESVPGLGSTFTVALPLPRLEKACEGGEVSGGVNPKQELPPLQVLAAEDNEVNQLVLRTLLQQLGVEPVIVGDGREAVEVWEGAQWDLILMDIQMPLMDGVTATKTIREREAALSRTRTPIVALTANVMTHQVAEYLAAGMDAVAAKPLQLTDLLLAIDTALTPREPTVVADVAPIRNEALP